MAFAAHLFNRALSIMRRPSASLAAMEARSVNEIPQGPKWQYEPMWDGFRCILARDGDNVTMFSKSGEDLKRYFPDIVSATLDLKTKILILDGEIVVPIEEEFSFNDLLQRIHPAASRVRMLAAKTPALYLAFDLLIEGKKDVATNPLSERRALLENFAEGWFAGHTLFRLSPASRVFEDAERWLRSASGGSDGVIAKRPDLSYQAGNRDGMQKIKRYRTADCVIGSFRYAEKRQAGGKVVGSVLLGLYDDHGLLHHVGFSSR
jgi:ATP-dependent DNA ligase